MRFGEWYTLPRAERVRAWAMWNVLEDPEGKTAPKSRAEQAAELADALRLGAR